VVWGHIRKCRLYLLNTVDRGHACVPRQTADGIGSELLVASSVVTYSINIAPVTLAVAAAATVPIPPRICSQTINLVAKRGTPEENAGQCVKTKRHQYLIQHSTAKHVLYDRISPNTGLIRLMTMYMTPFQGIRKAVETSTGRRMMKRYVNGAELLEALVSTSQIHQSMEQLHTDPAYPRLKADSDSSEAVLNL
jgi:hypothetical protein